MLSKGEHQTVPLSVLLKRELANEKIESPELSHGQASQSKKGEDFTFVKAECQRVLGDGVATYSVFGVRFFRQMFHLYANVVIPVCICLYVFDICYCWIIR